MTALAERPDYTLAERQKGRGVGRIGRLLTIEVHFQKLGVRFEQSLCLEQAQLDRDKQKSDASLEKYGPVLQKEARRDGFAAGKTV